MDVAVERIMTDDGPGCRSREFNDLIGSRNVHI